MTSAMENSRFASIQSPVQVNGTARATTSRNEGGNRAFDLFKLDSDKEKNEENNDIKGKVETKIMSMWNNMKFGWTVKMKTSFSKESPVWLLGRYYHRKISPYESLENSTELATEATSQQIFEQIEGEDIEGFKLDFTSKIWMTYRREFPAIFGSNYTTDCGWGCMLRSGQMLLAQALVCHFLGRSWRWNPEQQILTAKDFQEDCLHRMIIKWLGDKPSVNSPLSIHQMVKLGESFGKKPGDWYGPASVAHCLKAVIAMASNENYEFDDITVYVAQDSTIYTKDVHKLCMKEDGKWKSLIILVPTKLGQEKLNPIYGPCLTSLLTVEYCIGVIGGRPKHSLYFIGFQDDKLIHLDPHYCQDTVDVWQPNFPTASFHCKSPRKMLITKMDPSCCIGFYVSTKKQFECFVQNVGPYLIPTTTTNKEYPIFTINETDHCQTLNNPNIRYSLLEADKNWVMPSIGDSDTDFESEEFVML